MAQLGENAFEVLRKKGTERPLRVNMKPSGTREFIYVKDVARNCFLVQQNLMQVAVGLVSINP